MNLPSVIDAFHHAIAADSDSPMASIDDPMKPMLDTKGIRCMPEPSCRPSRGLDPPFDSPELPRQDRWRRRRQPSTWHHGLQPSICTLLFCLLVLIVSPTRAVFINFDNCLSPNVINSDPIQLQFLPLNFSAVFDARNASHNLNVTVYGNVTGSATTIPPPPPDDPQWDDSNATLGKIVDLSESNNKYSTLFSRFNVLSYTPYDGKPERFCPSVVQGGCPIAPVFESDGRDPSQLRAFTVAHDFYSSYAMTTLSSTITVTSGDASNALLACISANITPDLGRNLSSLLGFMPLAILVLTGAATAFAAMFSPWGSTDIFRWTSNYGRDADLLRLVTPGFGDCLQYIQFIVLTGGLSLSYPGYYQPVVSQASWSTLMFNASFVSQGNGTQSLVDGVYTTNGTYGLDRLSQLVGMSTVKDIWAGMVIWLLVIIAAVTAFIQLGFFLRWSYRELSNIQEEDLRAKNVPFTLGNVIRVVLNYFLLPAVALSMFQLVIAARPPLAPYTTALAVVLLLTLVGFAIWLLRLIATVRPRSYLFDDLPTVLMYGSLYNTYSDNAAAFALIPLFLQLIRGIAIGALQPSGIAQLVLLAICEVILVLTIHAFRPFQSPTSMNAYHTFFAIVRLLTTLLSVAFVPSLGVAESPKGWIGYVILLMHAIVLVFGFFLNSVQTLVEVTARLAGAGGEEGTHGGAARGRLVKVFGMRQLSRRVPRRPGPQRGSGISDAGMLGVERDNKSGYNSGRPRSTSGSSAVLLNRHTASDGRASTGLESNSAYGGPNRPSSGSVYTPTTPTGAPSAFSYLPGGAPTAGAPSGGIIGLKNADTADPYFRPPRKRPTAEGVLPSGRSKGSWTSADWANKRWSQHSAAKVPEDLPDEGPSVSGRATPVPAYLSSRDLSDPDVNEPRGSNTDYAVREVDFYYGVRGPALSNLPTRRLGTGPADPTGPVASAAGWVKSLFGGKTKEKGKGFEVVRSSRAPPPRLARPAADENETSPVEGKAMQAESVISEPDEGIGQAITQEDDPAESSQDDDMSVIGYEDGDEGVTATRLPDHPPSLPGIEVGGAIELPIRAGSKTSARPSRGEKVGRTPTVPRKSSKRKSIPVGERTKDSSRLSAIRASPPSSPGAEPSGLYDSHRHPNDMLRPSTASSAHFPFGSEASTGDGSRVSTGGESTFPAEDDNYQVDRHARHSSSALGDLAPDVVNDRPTSMGYVQQHRMSHNIHTVVHHSPDFLGSSAELVEAPSSREVSTERQPGGR
ncbi:MAG: hypothetical protein M1817_003389 [Caeruleum heppii]|nr:MAG: hypothetical protein M1817_003389 [Caeruleum heppii]